MFARGPMPGATPKAEALEVMPTGTYCEQVSSHGMIFYCVYLPDNILYETGGNAQIAWIKAGEKWERQVH